MKLTYFDVPSRAMINLSAIGNNLYSVDRVSVPNKMHRGKGIASRLMKEMLEEADNEGVGLTLWICASGGLTYDELATWYERCGFVRQESEYYLREALVRSTLREESI